MGSALLATGQTKPAIRYLARVSNTSETRLRADALLVRAYRKAAEDSYRRIAKLDPDSYRVHQLKAENLAWKNLTNQALLEYDEALKRKPDLEGVHRQMGELYRQRSNSTWPPESTKPSFALIPLTIDRI